MRISLLLQREPFPEIFEATAKRFLDQHYNQDFSVQWGRTLKEKSEDMQNWTCNPFLNIVFHKSASPEVFTPIINEYSYSINPWRRPLQLGYVKLATTHFFRMLFGRARISIYPPIPNASNLLWLGGNHKIRLLDFEKRVSHSILKSGFSDYTMKNEIRTRQLVYSMGIPTPRMLTIADDGQTFQEEYITGIPLNRLSDETKKQATIVEAFKIMHQLWEQTKESVDIIEYASQLLDDIIQKTSQISLLTELQASDVKDKAIALYKIIENKLSGDNYIDTTIAHGDFQPANILLDEHIWFIDWEYSKRRFYGYDFLTFGLDSRMPMGLSNRLQNWIQGLELLPEIRIDFKFVDREIIAALFLLEELELHLTENSIPTLTSVGRGFCILKSEVGNWLETMTDIDET